MRNKVQIVRYSIPGLAFKLAIVSDLHNQPYETIIDSLEHEKPRIILIPGDLEQGHYVDAKRVELDGRVIKFNAPLNAISFLRKCNQIAPTFYSRGNHEWRMDSKDIGFVKELGIHFLDNEYEVFNDYAIGGLSSTPRKENGKGRLEPETSWIAEYSSQPYFHILLAHHPEHWERYIKNTNIELTISGHAHGGQWRLFGKGIFAHGQGFFPKYTRGVYENKRLVVSAGLANTAKPIPRLFNPYELVYLE